MLLCGLQSFLAKSWDVLSYYPGKKSICCMVHSGKKTPRFPYLPVLQIQSMSGSMFYSFHSHPVRSPQALCLFPVICYCAAQANAAQGEATTLICVAWAYSYQKTDLKSFHQSVYQIWDAISTFIWSICFTQNWLLFVYVFLLVRKVFGRFQPSFGEKLSEGSSQIY